MKRLSPKWFVLIGSAILLAGFIYGGVFLGVPYQEPTLELQAKWDFHWQINNAIYLSGLLFVASGIAIAAFKSLFRAD
jgi:hypothetical protein